MTVSLSRKMHPKGQSTGRSMGTQRSSQDPDGNRRIKLAIVCGNMYAFRSMFAPVVRQLSGMASIRLFLQEYPQNYDISALLEEFRGSGIVESYSFIPSDSNHWRHHRALQAIYRSLPREKLDLLIIDEDSQPMSRYLIDLARSKNAVVVGLQKEIPVRLLAACETARLADESSPAPASPWRPRYQELLRRLNMLVRRPNFVIAVLWQRSKHLLRSRLNYWILPLLLVGRKLNVPEHHKITNGFPSTQVDVTIVYAQQFKEALHQFFPRLNVTVAQHPLAQNCRCDESGESQTRLLVVLSGPWRRWISPGNQAESIEERWCDAILQAMEIKGFSEVDIRPHPREAERYPERLAQRLHTHGVKAQVVDAKMQSLAEVICDYAGLLSAPSSLLAEANVSCQKGFVICLQDVEIENYWPPTQSLANGVVSKLRGSDLTAEDFTKLPIPSMACPTVCDVVSDLMTEMAHLPVD